MGGIGTGDTHQPTDSLHQQVVARQIRPGSASETCYRTIYQARIELLQALVAETELLHGARPEVFDHHVGSAC
ncbi:Uncharacterised protein [Mycobacteroides abscessus subsp. abscessus]|nr:Uncharacterised protein [Mycobacteroides abscessus subsp. abscessus]